MASMTLTIESAYKGISGAMTCLAQANAHVHLISHQAAPAVSIVCCGKPQFARSEPSSSFTNSSYWLMWRALS